MKKKSVFFKYIHHDIRNGLVNQWIKYLIAAVIFLFLCGTLYQLVVLDNGYSSGNTHLSNPTLGDYLYHLLCGMELIVLGRSKFATVDFLWVLINLFLAYIVSFYPFKDLHGFGQLMLIRSQKRDYWWMSKCIWIVGCVTLYYVVMWIAAIAFTVGTGGELTLVPTAEIQELATNGRGSVEGLNAQNMLLRTLVYPWLASLTISMLQMTVSLLTQPVIGLLTVCVVVTVSIFNTSFWAPGNYMMLIRQHLPIHWDWGCWLMVFVVLLSVAVGYIDFKRHDIFSA